MGETFKKDFDTVTKHDGSRDYSPILKIIDHALNGNSKNTSKALISLCADTSNNTVSLLRGTMDSKYFSVQALMTVLTRLKNHDDQLTTKSQHVIKVNKEENIYVEGEEITEAEAIYPPSYSSICS